MVQFHRPTQPMGPGLRTDVGMTFVRWAATVAFTRGSMNFRLGYIFICFQEIKVAAFVGLLDVCSV
jgi:hypothetical protein